MAYQYGNAERAEEFRKREAEARAMHYAEQSEEDYETKAVCTPPVQMEMESLEKAVVQLRDRVSQLEERLSGVLAPVPISESVNRLPEKHQSFASPLATHIHHIRELTDEASRKLSGLLSALEI